MIAKLVLASVLLLATGATAYAFAPFAKNEEFHAFGCPKGSR